MDTNPTHDAMVLLGATTIAEVLGTYQGLLNERARMFNELLQDRVSDPEHWAETSRELFLAWRAAERRLDLYRLLAHEALA